MLAYRLARPLLFRLEPERAHALTIAGLRLLPTAPPAHDPVLASRVAGIDFPAPVGLAAGFDKNAEVPAAMLALGFGFVEVGTLTPRAQAGNPRPRLFRLVEDAGVVNRLGFNNQGQAAALARLRQRPRGMVGVNIGANKDSADRIADYVAGIAAMAPVADYLTLNISSPNTPGLRDLQQGSEFVDLLAAATTTRGSDGPPLFVKIAPDLDRAGIDTVVRAAIDAGIDALIIGNTTVSRPSLRSRHSSEIGGLSGAPLAVLAAERLADCRRASGGEIALIAAGGIDSGAEAYARIRAGASLVQLYTALVYHGPGLVARINRDLAALLRRDGFATLGEAVGTAV